MNPCGGCTACCTVLSVKELGKAPHVRCDRVGEAGCTCYESRPGSCRNWSCLWALGVIPGEPKFRPDQVGLVLDMVTMPSGSFVVAYEVWAGASEEPEGILLLNDITRTHKVCVLSPDRGITSWEPGIGRETEP